MITAMYRGEPRTKNREKPVKNNDFISGMYIWTGFDYIGEPTPFWYPAKLPISEL